jgi:hypothetical protein
MKTIASLIILGLLLYVSGYYWGYKGAIVDSNEQALQRMFDESEAVIAEMRGLTADAQAAVAGVRKAEQERNSEGEARREKMSTAMRTDKCADVVVPDAVNNGLLRKGAGTNPPDSPVSTGKPDK